MTGASAPRREVLEAGLSEMKAMSKAGFGGKITHATGQGTEAVAAAGGEGDCAGVAASTCTGVAATSGGRGDCASVSGPPPETDTRV